MNYVQQIAKIIWFNIFLASICSNAFAQNVPIVARVNEQPISLDIIIHAVNELPSEIQSQPFLNYYEELLERVIDINLLAQEARSKNIQNEESVRSAITFITDKILMQAYLSKIVKNNISDADIQKAYKNYVGDKASREEINASHILLETEDEANIIISKINNGVGFEELAKEYSKGPSGPNGGSLGWFPRGQMVPGFEAEAFSLTVGNISQKPVQTQFGWHVIKVLDKKIPEPPTFDSMKVTLAQDIERRIISKTIQEVRSTASIVSMSSEELSPILDKLN